MRILFIAVFGPIVRDLDASRNIYGRALGISFKEEESGYFHTEALNGAKSFSLWPLSQPACPFSFTATNTEKFVFIASLSEASEIEAIKMCAPVN
jgi:hypothetical protein